jgi:hypothetical protein
MKTEIIDIVGVVVLGSLLGVIVAYAALGGFY